MLSPDSFRYKAFHDAVAADTLTVDELAAYQAAVEEGTTAELLAGWSETHSDPDFRQICHDTAVLMGWEFES